MSQQGPSFSFDIRQIGIPTVGPLDILVRLSVTGICHTDIALAVGALGPCRSILGHEGVGRIVEVGKSIPASTVLVGQRVGIGWLSGVCHECDICHNAEEERRCLKQLNYGRHVDGTFAEYVIIDLQYLLPLPEGPPDELIAPVLCGGVTAYKALKVSGAQPGQWVALLGAGGGLGAFGVQYAKTMGLKIIAIDGGSHKGQLCRSLGADVYIDFLNTPDTVDAVQTATDRKGVVAALVLAGSGKAYQDALGMLAPFGSLVAVGIPPPGQELKLHPLKLIGLGIRLIGSLVGSRADILEVVDLVASGAVTPIVSIRNLGELTKVAHEMEEGKVRARFRSHRTISLSLC
jgi:propanol-preferring alcohol dehydrogenase